jgi:glycerol-3-phosphate dehydrogenase (NAD(P)+)
MIGEGLAPDEAMRRVGMVVEGAYTAESAYGLSKAHGVEMPITEQVYRVLKGEADARDSVSTLMTRQRKHEPEDLLV